MDWANGFFPINKILQLRNWLPCKLVKWGMEGRELSSEPAEGISAEVERWDSMISTSFVTLRMDERFGHYNFCDVSIKVAYLGWRVETIYTKTQLCLPQVQFPLTALTSEPQHIREPARVSPRGTSPWQDRSGSPLHTHRTGFVQITATGCQPRSS